MYYFSNIRTICKYFATSLCWNTRFMIFMIPGCFRGWQRPSRHFFIVRKEHESWYQNSLKWGCQRRGSFSVLPTHELPFWTIFVTTLNANSFLDNWKWFHEIVKIQMPSYVLPKWLCFVELAFFPFQFDSRFCFLNWLSHSFNNKSWQ